MDKIFVEICALPFVTRYEDAQNVYNEFVICQNRSKFYGDNKTLAYIEVENGLIHMKWRSKFTIDGVQFFKTKRIGILQLFETSESFEEIFSKKIICNTTNMRVIVAACAATISTVCVHPLDTFYIRHQLKAKTSVTMGQVVWNLHFFFFYWNVFYHI